MFGIQELSAHVEKYIIFNTEYIATSLKNVMTKIECTHTNDIEENVHRIHDSMMHKIYRIQYVMIYQKRSNIYTKRVLSEREILSLYPCTPLRQPVKA
jgi:hypothetical protein